MTIALLYFILAVRIFSSPPILCSSFSAFSQNITAKSNCQRKTEERRSKTINWREIQPNITTLQTIRSFVTAFSWRSHPFFLFCLTSVSSPSFSAFFFPPLDFFYFYLVLHGWRLIRPILIITDSIHCTSTYYQVRLTFSKKRTIMFVHVRSHAGHYL